LSFEAAFIVVITYFEGSEAEPRGSNGRNGRKALILLVEVFL
jgi:hypothetical protein